MTKVEKPLPFTTGKACVISCDEGQSVIVEGIMCTGTKPIAVRGGNHDLLRDQEVLAAAVQATR